MPISPYSQPAQTQFMPTYIPEPFEQILGAGLARQGRYDTNLAAQEQAIADLESMSAIPGADTEYLNRAVATMRDVADQYATKDYGNREVVREIARSIRQGGVNRRTLADIQSTYTAKREYDKLALQLDTPQDLLQDFSKYSSQVSGAFSGTPERGYDRRKKKESYFDDVKANVYTNPDTGVISEYIDQNDLDRLTQAGTDDYVRSNEGKQDIDLYRKRTGITKDQMSDRDIAEQLLLDTSEEIRLKRSRILSGSGRTKDPKYPFGIGNTQRLQNPNINDRKPLEGTLFDKTAYDEKGNLLDTYKSRDAYEEAVREQIKDPYSFTSTKIDRIPRDYKKNRNLEEQVAKIQEIQNIVPELQGLPHEQVIAAYENARSGLSAFDNQKALIENVKDKEDITFNVMSDLKSRGVYTAESDSPIKITTPDKLYKELDVSKEDGDKFVVNGIVPGKGVYDMAIVDKSGLPKASFEVTLNQEEHQPLLPLMKAQEIHLKGDVGVKTFKVGNKKFAVATTMAPTNDDQGGLFWDFVTNVGEIASETPYDDGTYDYLSEPIPLDMMDSQYTDYFRTLYSSVK